VELYTLSCTQQHNIGIRENNLAYMPLNVGPVPFHMIFQLHFHYVIPIIWWPSLTKTINFFWCSWLIFLLYCLSLRSVTTHLFTLLCVFTFRYDFRIKTMLDSSLPPVVCRRVHVLFTLFVFAYVWHIVLCCVCFSASCVPYVASSLWNVHLWLPFRYPLTFILY
jgi:hypothetical protein